MPNCNKPNETPQAIRIVGPAAELLAVFLMVTTAAEAQTEPATRPAGPQTYALLIGGMPGTPVHARRYADWLGRFRKFLVGRAEVAEDNVVVLTGDDRARRRLKAGQADREGIREAVASLARRVRPEDQFILMLVGHGGKRVLDPTLLIVGEDLSAAQLALAVQDIRSENQVFLLFNGAAGKWVEYLHGQGRTIVAATMPEQGAEPVYAEFFLRGLESKRADGEGASLAGEKDGTITLLEAYNWSTYQTALWIARIRAAKLIPLSPTVQVVDEEAGWNVVGRESVEVFRKLYVAPEGTRGRRVLGPGSKPNVDDPIVALRAKVEFDPDLSSRRMIAENASLEDCAAKAPVSALGAPDKDYQPLAGFRPGEPGWLARRVVLGRPGLLPQQSPPPEQRTGTGEGT